MSLGTRTLVSVAGVLALGVASAAADPIRITSGALIWPSAPTGSVTLNGPNFTFSGNTGPTEGLFTPLSQCEVPECVAGTTVNLRTVVSGVGYRSATATYDGRAFAKVGSMTADSSLFTEWDGSLVLPAGFSGGSLTAPFSFSGMFFIDDPGGSRRLDLVGAGTASLTFAPYGGGGQFPGAFTVDSMRYDFADVAATPEPASLLLLGSGLCGIAAARRRRQAQRAR